MLTSSQAMLFRRWTLGDPASLDAARDPEPRGSAVAHGPVAALLRIAALVAVDATTPAYQREVNAALAAGASADDIIDVLRAITGVVGSAHAMAAAPRLALALGYDVDEDLELLDASLPG